MNLWMNGHQSPWVPHSLLKSRLTLCLFLVQMDPGRNPPTRVLKYVSYNFTGLAGNETMAIETLRIYGVSSCGLLDFTVLLVRPWVANAPSP